TCALRSFTGSSTSSLVPFPKPARSLLPHPPWRPYVSMAHEWSCPSPRATKVTPSGNSTLAGDREVPALAPFPSRPRLAEPQHQVRSVVSRAQVWLQPRLTCVNVTPGAFTRVGVSLSETAR